MMPSRRLPGACLAAAVAACTPLGLWVYDDPGLEVSRVRLDSRRGRRRSRWCSGWPCGIPTTTTVSTARLELQLRLDDVTVGHFSRDSIIPVRPGRPHRPRLAAHRADRPGTRAHPGPELGHPPVRGGGPGDIFDAVRPARRALRPRGRPGVPREERGPGRRRCRRRLRPRPPRALRPPPARCPADVRRGPRAGGGQGAALIFGTTTPYRNLARCISTILDGLVESRSLSSISSSTSASRSRPVIPTRKSSSNRAPARPAGLHFAGRAAAVRGFPGD